MSKTNFASPAFFFKKNNLFLVEGWLLYSFTLVSIKHQHESAIVHLLVDHVQFALIPGPNIPGFYATLLQHRTNFTTRHIHNWVSFLLWPSCFILSGAISYFPSLFPISIMYTFWPGASTSRIISFYLSILFMGISQQEYWSESPFPPPADHVFLELFTMTHLSRVAMHSMAHNFIELHIPLLHDNSVVHEGDSLALASWFSRQMQITWKKGRKEKLNLNHNLKQGENEWRRDTNKGIFYCRRIWKIPWMEEPGGLQSMGSLRVGDDWVTSLSLFSFMHWRRKWQYTPVFLPGESQGRGSLVGCRLWGCTESDTTEAT